MINKTIGKNSKILGKSFKVGDFIKVNSNIFSEIVGTVAGQHQTTLYLSGKRKVFVKNSTKYTKKIVTV